MAANIHANTPKYPEHWWKPVPEDELADWEIGPQAAAPGEVILSKRNELGIFSNFGEAKFEFEDKSYNSIEGFWQMMKYPDSKLESDPRVEFKDLYPSTREKVSQMIGFEAKEMGDAANEVNYPKKIKWVSYKGKKFNYKDYSAGSAYHLDLIKRATKAKVFQNPWIKKLLLKTKGLKLRPDHSQGKNPPASYKYYEILMKIRDEL